MNNPVADKWNRIYASAATVSNPAPVLSENQFLLPQVGRALDLASGLGANAILLAKQGLTTEAWDISTIAMRKLQQQAEAHAIVIETFTRDISSQSFLPDVFDVIVVSRFLDRSICDAIMASLKPNGLLFYQTYTRHKTFACGPTNPRFLLAENELLQLFSSLTRVYYRENADLGMVQQGLRNEAQFIGRKFSNNEL